MTDFKRARALMLDNQIRTGGVTDRRLLFQLGAVPRELFVPQERRPIAYCDDVHWFPDAQSARFMAPPTTLARLLQLAEIGGQDTVLDIGAATGYSTAVIAGLAKSVVGLEQDAGLAAQAVNNLGQLALGNASIVAGEIGGLGAARFDVVMVEGMLDRVPAAFFDALGDGGRLVVLIRDNGVGVAQVFVRTGRAITARSEFNATLPPLFSAPVVEDFVL